jgi:ADP-ribose pyrophosphatase YjhB (NUDIX family)
MAPATPWMVLDRAMTLEDPRLRVHSDLCLTPQGEIVGPAHVIESPDQVAIVALSAAMSDILLIRRYRHGVGTVVTGLPGCIIEPVQGNPHLDVAEIVARREYRNRARRAGMPPPPSFQPRPDCGMSSGTVAEAAAKRELFEQTGYTGGQWSFLAKSHLESSRQTGSAYCFLATALQKGADGPADDTVEVIEQDLIVTLRLVQRGGLAMDAVHVAALWSASSQIAADDSGRFGALATQLRRFFVGEDDQSTDQPVIPGASRHGEVGG